MTFFEINELTDFDMILGEQGLRQIKARLNLFEYKIYYEKQIHSHQIHSHQINYTNDCPKYELELQNIMNTNENICETLPFTTTIEASIRTISDEPIWSKQYPYPYTDKEFVDEEIEKLLNDGIIEEIFSPYNSPIWTVPK